MSSGPIGSEWLLEERLGWTAAALPGLRLLVLFGSTARRGARDASDIDLGVLLDHREGWAGRRAAELALGRAAGRAVDLVDLETAPPLLRFEIACDGRLLHEGRPHQWADFRARAMLDWWDWAPTARMIHGRAAARLRQVEHGPS